MKRLIILFLFLCTRQVLAQNITAIEYFFDADPGFGSGTPIAITPSNTISNLSFSINLTSISNGSHNLCYRAKDVNGKWSVTYVQPIYKAMVPATLAINKLEYFLDADPGYGAGVDVPIVADVSITNQSFLIPLSASSNGFHQLTVRARDSNGNWSLAYSKSFYKLNGSIAGLPNITKLEYFIDADPGYGSGTDVPITAAASISNQPFTIQLNGITDGTHQLSVRARDANGNWSIIYAKSFSVCNQAIPVASAATAITTSGFTANWAAATGATGYTLDVSTDNFATFVTGYNSKSITGLTQAVTGLSPGVTYSYRVSAVNATCTSVASNVILATTVFTTPTATAATAITSSGFTANWAAVTGATGYLLDISTDNFATFITGYNSKSTTALSEVVTGLTASTAYQYRVRATNGVGTSANSSTITATTTVAAPVASAATAINSSGFTANWASVTGATGYQLDISTDNFATFVTGYNSKAETGTTDVVTSLVASTAYQYRVRATNSGGTSVNSNVITVTTSAAAPAAPVASAATAVTSTGFIANWASVTGATGYQLDVSADNFATFVTGYNSKSITTTTQAVSGLTASTAYKYRVRAVNSIGASANSNSISVTTLAASPVLNITQGTTTIATNGTFDFGNVNMLSNSGSISFNVQNNGNAALAVDQINSSVTGANASDFALDLSALGASISPGSAGIVKVVFTPSASGSRTATVSVISNDPASPYIVNLKGTGVKIDQTITFGALPTKSVTDAPFTLAATSTSKLGVSYTSSNAAVATISGNTVTIVGAGTSTITASQSGDGNYNAATPVTQTLTVTAQQSQSITFATLPAKTFGDPAFILTATGGASGLPVTFASSNTSVATVSGTTVTIVGAGTTTITASQAGNANFLAAADVPQTLTVNKASQTITFANLPAKNVGDPPFTLTATGGASGLPITFTSSNTAVATISGNTVTIVGAGTTTITASQAGNANYNAATSVTQTLTVNAKQNQTITFTALADVTLGASFSLTATASSGLAVSYTTNTSKATITGTTVTTIKAGRDTIIATQPGNSSFNAATPVSQSFCIKPAKPTITLSNGNTATVTLTSSATSGNQWYLNGTAITGATNATLSVTAAGVYKVQAKADDCVSDFSADQAIIVTGDLLPSASTVSVSPNPVESVLQLNGIVGEIKSNQLFDMAGRASSPLTLEKKNEVYQASVEHLSQGVYVLRILQENRVVQIKFVKK